MAPKREDLGAKAAWFGLDAFGVKKSCCSSRVALHRGSGPQRLVSGRFNLLELVQNLAGPWSRPLGLTGSIGRNQAKRPTRSTCRAWRTGVGQRVRRPGGCVAISTVGAALCVTWQILLLAWALLKGLLLLTLLVPAFVDRPRVAGVGLGFDLPLRLGLSKPAKIKETRSSSSCFLLLLLHPAIKY